MGEGMSIDQVGASIQWREKAQLQQRIAELEQKLTNLRADVEAIADKIDRHLPLDATTLRVVIKRSE